MTYPAKYRTGPISVVANAAYEVGDVFVAGELIGVCLTKAASGEGVSIALAGGYDFPLKAGDTPTLGAKIYWDSSNSVVTTTAAGNTRIGTCIKANSGEVWVTIHKLT